ncbi:MAG: lytic transglycosylase domain-containing protein [Tannerella sp.]|jgi:hypothetical protein|nr:lytic transglycosylase domain-containing protein [Tannerella sp.]
MAQNPAQPSPECLNRSPEVPSQIVFCGQTVHLKRYNMAEGMDRELSSFSYLHASTMLCLKRANRYFPEIEPILKANGVPDDFKYLAVVESLLDPCAVSPARAAGIWQFLESTAKQYGLVVTSTVDERYNVRRSTEAACKYLLDAYKIYGDWTAVAASYNAGMGRISGELGKQKVASVFDLWLVEETTRYVYRIFAIKQVFEDPRKYGFAIHAKNLYKPMQYREIKVNEDIPDLVAYAQKYQITFADLKRFNPWLKDTKLDVNGKSFVLLIPSEEELYYESPNKEVYDTRWIQEE